MRNWTHFHSIATGTVFGLLLDRHVLYVFFLGLIIGALVVYSSRTLRALGKAAGSRAAELHAATVDGMRARAAKARADAEHRIRRAAEQAAAEKKAYIAGAIDAKP